MSRRNREIIAEACRDVSTETTIHGLNILGAPKLHILERALWFGIVILALAGAISLTLSSWRRYSENPTVVSLQKDFRNWKNPFPAVTGCFVKKIDERKAKNLAYQRWAVTESDEKYNYYMSFINAVANISYLNLGEFKQFENDTELNVIDMLEIAVKVHPKLSGTLVTFDSRRKTKWQLVMTELGLCFSVNTKFANILSTKLTSGNNTDEDDITILKCHYLNGLCYGRYDSEPSLPLQYYIHSYLDVAHATSESPLLVQQSEELEINYRMQETVSAPSLRGLSPAQRGCRFDNEPLKSDFPVFSSTMCYVECRYRLALKLCGCKPFFYNYLGGRECDLKGLLCLAKYSETITSPPAQIGCQCPQPCDIIIYLPQIPKKTRWEYGYFDQRITFRWGLVPPTTKYHRDILFGIDSLVASSGGTVSLFLGMSVIGLIEFLYLIIENIYKAWKKMKESQLRVEVIHKDMYKVKN